MVKHIAIYRILSRKPSEEQQVRSGQRKRAENRPVAMKYAPIRTSRRRRESRPNGPEVRYLIYP